MENLKLAMRVQAIAFAAYGVSFFLIPDFTLDTIFQWETASFFPRSLGATFLGIAWLEWSLVDQAAEILGAIWGFVVIPVGIFIAFVWERAAGDYTGSEVFYWVSIVVTVVFATLVGGTRLTAVRA